MKYLQTGRSMVEMLAVIALMGLITSAGLAGYNQVIVRNQALNIEKDALSRAAAVNTLSPSYFVRHLNNVEPITLPGFSNNVQGIIVTTRKETNASFITTYTNVPKRVCQRVIETNAIGLYNTAVNNVNVSPENIADICNQDVNTISFSFYRAGYTSTTIIEAEPANLPRPAANPCAEIRCNGCQVCLNGICVNDQDKCAGCQTCDLICIDDNSKCENGFCHDGSCYGQGG